MALEKECYQRVNNLRGRDGIPLVQSLADEFFRNPDDANDAAQEVWVFLIENDCARVRQFRGEGQSAFYAYIVTTITRKLLSIRRRTVKRCQYPKAIEAQGDVWILAYRLMCCKKYSRLEALEYMRFQMGFLGSDEQTMKEAISGVLAFVKKCGSSTHFQDGVNEIEAPQTRPADFLLRSLLAFVFSHCKNRAREGTSDTLELFSSFEKSPPNFVDTLCRELKQKLMLSQEQIIILRLFYEYGFTAKEIGQRLRLNVNQVNSRRRTVIQWIRKILEDTNLDKELRRWLEEL